MTSLADKFDAFITQFSTFQGRMTKFEETEERWHQDTNTRLTNIEHQIQKVCLDNEQVTAMFTNLKEGETRQEASNLQQTAKNAARSLEQTAQDVKIRDLEEGERIMKLSTKDIAKITAIITPIVAGIIEMLKWLTTRTF